jgi:hypothetical protein
MPESPNQVSSGQRRANWVALRTLHQLPKAVGETAGGEQIYEVRSVLLLLDGAAGHFVRLAECSRCGRQLAGAPVLTAADLDRPLRPMICGDCIRGAGVSTVWESEGGEPAGERPAPAAAVAERVVAESAAASPPEPAPAPAGVKQPERLQVLEGHLRAVTDRVNELGRITRSHQADLKERAQREEGTESALREELAALRTVTDDIRAELRRLAEAQTELKGLAEARAELAEVRAELQSLAAAQAEVQNLAEARAEVQNLAEVRAELQSLAASQAELAEAQAELGREPAPQDRLTPQDIPAPGDAGAGLVQLREEVAQLARLVEAQRGEVIGAPGDAGAGLVQLRGEVAQLARLVEAQRGEVVGFVAAVGETQRLTSALAAAHEALAETVASVGPADVEDRIAARLSVVEGDVAEALARPLAKADLSKVEELVAARLAEAEGRLANQIAGQWGDLETAIEGTVKAYMAGFERAGKELMGGQAVLEERIDTLASQVIEASRHVDAVRERVAVRDAAGHPVPAPAPGEAPPGSFLDDLDRQLDAAARRLAARSQAGAGGADQ